MDRYEFDTKLSGLKQKYDNLTSRKNSIDENWYNGIYDRYENCVLTRNHIPLEWRFDLNYETNPHLLNE